MTIKPLLALAKIWNILVTPEPVIIAFGSTLKSIQHVMDSTVISARDYGWYWKVRILFKVGLITESIYI